MMGYEGKSIRIYKYKMIGNYNLSGWLLQFSTFKSFYHAQYTAQDLDVPSGQTCPAEHLAKGEHQAFRLFLSKKTALLKRCMQMLKEPF